MIVIDCSYTMALVMPDEQQPASLTRTLESRLVAPGLWPLEVANALRNVVRRGRLRFGQRQKRGDPGIEPHQQADGA